MTDIDYQVEFDKADAWRKRLSQNLISTAVQLELANAKVFTFKQAARSLAHALETCIAAPGIFANEQGQKVIDEYHRTIAEWL